MIKIIIIKRFARTCCVTLVLISVSLRRNGRQDMNFLFLVIISIKEGGKKKTQH